MRRVRGQVGQADRMAHILRVARLSGRLAYAHGLPAEPARLAALLHDLARLYSADRLLEECARRGLAVDAFERANPVVLHARVGAELAREEFGVRDERVLAAIRKHTVGADVMSPLDAVLYLADGLEPGRRFPARAALAALAFHDLDAAMREVLASTIEYLERRGLAIAPQTLAARAHYEARMGAGLQPPFEKEHCSA